MTTAGNAGYYRSFMLKLHTSLGGRAHILSCSHAGHELGPHNTGQRVSDVAVNSFNLCSILSRFCIQAGVALMFADVRVL